MIKKVLSCLVAVSLMISLVFVALPKHALAADWLTGWDYRKSKTIGASEVVTDFTVTGGATPLTLHTGVGVDDDTNLYFNNKCKDYFDDIRVTESDGTTLLDYALRPIDADTAELCVETDVSASPTTLYIYYGNADACRYDDGFNTFIGYEHSLFVDNIGANDGSYYDAWPSICRLHDNTLITVWQRGSSHSAQDGDLLYSLSVDQGRTWGAPVILKAHGVAFWYGVQSITEVYNTIISKWQIMVIFGIPPIPFVDVARTYVISSIDGGTNWGNNFPDYNNNSQTIIGAIGYGTWNPPIQLSVAKPGEPRPRIILSAHTTAFDCYTYYSTDFGATWIQTTIGTDALDPCELALLELKDSGAYTGYIYCLARNNAAPYGYSKIISKDYGDNWGTNSPNFDDGVFAASGLVSDSPEKGNLYRMNSGTAIAAYCPLAGDDDGELRVVKASAEDKDITWDATNYALVWRSRNATMQGGDYAYATMCNITDAVDSQIGIVWYYGNADGIAPSYIASTWIELGNFVGTKRLSHSTTTKITSQTDSLLITEAAASNNFASMVCDPSVTTYLVEAKVKNISQSTNDQNMIAACNAAVSASSFILYFPVRDAQSKVGYYSGGVVDLWTSYVEGVLSRFIVFCDEDNDKYNYFWYTDPYTLKATSGLVAPASATDTEKLQIGSSSTAGQAYANWYWLTVRKYTATEPAWGLTGSEEEPPVPPAPAALDVPANTGLDLLNAVVVVAYIGGVILVTIAIGSRSTVAALLFMAVAVYLGVAFVTAIQEAINAFL